MTTGHRSFTARVHRRLTPAGGFRLVLGDCAWRRGSRQRQVTLLAMLMCNQPIYIPPVLTLSAPIPSQYTQRAVRQ